MDYKVLYRKYRPNSFKNIFGQDFIVKTLVNSIENNRISHAYLFTGPRGTGKTSTAKIFAKVLNCLNLKGHSACEECSNCLNVNENPDIIEIDAASNNGIDEIRELRNNVKISPANSKYKIYIIDEVHMLSTEAFNALLKTLEEPPSHVVFILATTDIQKVPITILSRCQRFDFNKITNEDIIKTLKDICLLEKISISDEALEEIAFISDGGLRDALSLLDQLNIDSKKEIDLSLVSSVAGSVSNKNLLLILKALEEDDAKTISVVIEKISNLGANYKMFVEKLALKLRDYSLNITPTSRFTYEIIKKLIFELYESLNLSKNASNPYILTEILLLGMVNLPEKIQNDPKIISREIILEEKNDENESKMAEEEPNIIINDKKTHSEGENREKGENVDNFEDVVKIRINNCFVNASKETLGKMKDKWDDFLDNIKFESQAIVSLLLDSSIVASSDEYAIIETNAESQANLLNKDIGDIEKMFVDVLKTKKVKLVAITKERWAKEKDRYIQKLKDHYEYKLMEEKTPSKEKVTTKIEKLAADIFAEDKIKIK